MVATQEIFWWETTIYALGHTVQFQYINTPCFGMKAIHILCNDKEWATTFSVLFLCMGKSYMSSIRTSTTDDFTTVMIKLPNQTRIWMKCIGCSKILQITFFTIIFKEITWEEKFLHNPPDPLKVGTWLSALIPAPVNTRTLRDLESTLLKSLTSE